MGSTVMRLVIKNGNAVFKVDNYRTISTVSDDTLNETVWSYIITEGSEFFYYFDVNMRERTISIFCSGFTSTIKLT